MTPSASHFDPYLPCPACVVDEKLGKIKKLKFCCQDLLSELEKIENMIEGDQPAACLEYVESLNARFPGRACLWANLASLQTRAERYDQAAETLAQFRNRHPHNPVALAQTAVLTCLQQSPVAAVPLLQQALAAAAEVMPTEILDACLLLGQGLLAAGSVPAARAHLSLAAALTEQNQAIVSMLLQIDGSPNIPLLLKQDQPLPPCPENALWKNAFQAAQELAHRGAWQQAADRLYALAAEAGDWPVIWRSLATLRSWLADTQGMVEALRKYAAQQVPEDDAIEAEALAQLFDEEPLEDVVSIEYTLSDLESLLAALAADSRLSRMTVDLNALAEEGQPPPRAAYWILDRPQLRSASGLTRQQVPLLIGQLFVFGRQTDRPAWAELSATRSTELPRSQATLDQILGANWGTPGAEEVTSRVPLSTLALSWRWRLPDDTPFEQRTALEAEQRRAALLEHWTQVPQPALGGKTADAAAADPACQRPLAALVLRLELSATTLTADDLQALRQRLGLPQPADIDGQTVSIASVPLARLGRVNPATLSDDHLVAAVYRAITARHVAALRELGPAFASRPALHAQAEAPRIFRILVALESDTARGLTLVELGRQAARTAGAPTASWDLTELSLRLAREELPHVQRLITQVQTEHGRDQNVMRGLLQLLYEAGLIRADGAPAVPPPPGIVVPGAAAAEPGKLWTPDGAAAPATGKKPAIWTPGMD